MYGDPVWLMGFGVLVGIFVGAIFWVIAGWWQRRRDVPEIPEILIAVRNIHMPLCESCGQRTAVGVNVEGLWVCDPCEQHARELERQLDE